MSRFLLLLSVIFAVIILQNCSKGNKGTHGELKLTRNCKPDKPIGDYEITIQPDIVYSQDGGYHNKLDLYLPRDNTVEKKPVVLFLHPGVFIGGDKSDYLTSKVCQDFARHGFVAAAVNYTLLTDVESIDLTLSDLNNFENPVKSNLYDAVRDISTAVRFLKENSVAYNIDPEQIYLVGYSAGAILALLHIFMDDNQTEQYFGSSITKGDSECQSCLPTNESSGGISHEVAGVIAINGAIFDHQIIDDDDKTPVLLIYSRNDEVLSPGIGRAFAKYSNNDIRVNIPFIAFELGFTRSTGNATAEKFQIIGPNPYINIPKWLPVLTNSAIFPTMYGSKAIFEKLSPKTEKYIFELPGGHNFVVDPESGMFNCAYDQIRHLILDFIQMKSKKASKKRGRNRN